MERIIKTALLWFCIALLMPASATTITAAIYVTDIAIDDWSALRALSLFIDSINHSGTRL